MQDFRTRIVCPSCGESTPALLVLEKPTEDLADIRRCLSCLYRWRVDGAPPLLVR
jgi:hypothetical protein